jgi:hypothetical protein
MSQTWRITTKRGLRIHYGKSLHCGAHAAACQAYIRRYNIARPHSFLNEPWDFANDDETSVACVARPSLPPLNNTVDVETDVDKGNLTQNANQFGIKYTAAQFNETKLLKILNDAAAPHFLYHKIYLGHPRQNATSIHSVLHALSNLPK